MLCCYVLLKVLLKALDAATAVIAADVIAVVGSKGGGLLEAV